MEETRGEFYPLGKLMEFGTKPMPAIYKALTRQVGPSALGTIIDELDKRGLRGFSFLGQGDWCMAFYSSDGMVVRLASASEPERPPHPAILQPIQSFICSSDDGIAKCKVEILPYVNTERVNGKHVAMLAAALEASGYEVDDICKKGNVGLILHNNEYLPVLLDPGLLKPIRNWKGPPDNLAEILAPWQGAQEAYDSRIITHSLTDAIPRETLDSMEKTLTGGKRESLVTNALRAGFYPSDISHMAHMAEQRSLLEGTDWYTNFKQELGTYQKAPQFNHPSGRSRA